MTGNDVLAQVSALPWAPPHLVRTQRPAVPTRKPIWRFAIGWVLLLPMLYLAENGNIIPSMGGSGVSTDAAGGSSPVHKIEVAIMTVYFLAVILTRKAPLFQSLLRSKLVLCLPLLAVSSSIWSEQPLHSFISGTILLVFTVFAVCVAADLDFQRQVELIMLVGAVALPVSIILAIFVPSIGSSGAWRGIFVHKQNCAIVCTLWLITALHWSPQGFHLKFIKALYIMMCALLIVMSQSRTGWLLALVAVLLWIALWAAQLVRRLEILLGLAVSMPVVLAGAYAVHTFFALLTSSVGKDATLTQRTIIWPVVWHSIMQSPYLGYGFSAFWSGLEGPSERVVLVAGWGIEQAQNGYLDLWLGMGFVGILILAVMVANSLRASVRTVRARASESQSRWCTVVIVTVLLLNTLEGSFCLLHMSWFLFLVACMGLQSLSSEKYALQVASPLTGRPAS
jgi:exopolysaccharide production protein ExoQ